MAGARCRVAFTDSEGIEHAVEIEAESLYEAVALAVAEFRSATIAIDPPRATTEFRVSVLRQPTHHTIRLQQVTKWAQGTTREGPAGILKRQKSTRVARAGLVFVLLDPAVQIPSVKMNTSAGKIKC